MTIVAGLEAAGGVWLGADALMSGKGECSQVTNKLFLRGKVGYGVVGDFRHSQVVRHHLNVRAPGKSLNNEEWCVRRLVPNLRRLAEEHGLWEWVKDDKDKGMLVLVAVRGRLFVLQEDWAVYRQLEGYAAIGSGAPYAYGALAMSRPSRLDPKKRMRRVIESTYAHCTKVGGRVQLLWVPA